jgi:hypothetical protein
MLGIGDDYRSEWATNDGYWMSVIIAILFSAFISLLSTTLFVNRIKAIAGTWLLSVTTWFAVPTVFMTYVIIDRLRFIITYQN